MASQTCRYAQASHIARANPSPTCSRLAFSGLIQYICFTEPVVEVSPLREGNATCLQRGYCILRGSILVNGREMKIEMQMWSTVTLMLRASCERDDCSHDAATRSHVTTKKVAAGKTGFRTIRTTWADSYTEQSGQAQVYLNFVSLYDGVRILCGMGPSDIIFGQIDAHLVYFFVALLLHIRRMRAYSI